MGYLSSLDQFSLRTFLNFPSLVLQLASSPRIIVDLRRIPSLSPKPALRNSGRFRSTQLSRPGISFRFESEVRLESNYRWTVHVSRCLSLDFCIGLEWRRCAAQLRCFKIVVSGWWMVKFEVDGWSCRLRRVRKVNSALLRLLLTSAFLFCNVWTL